MNTDQSSHKQQTDSSCNAVICCPVVSVMYLDWKDWIFLLEQEIATFWVHVKVEPKQTLICESKAVGT